MEDIYRDIGKSKREDGAHIVQLISGGDQITGTFYGYPNYNKFIYTLYPADIDTATFYEKHIVSMRMVSRKGRAAR